MVIITRLLLIALTLLLMSEYISGITVTGVYPAVVTAIILGLLSLFVRPVLLVLTLPINMLTLGLFTFVINAGLFWFTASIIEGFTVDGFWPALLGSLILSLVSTLSTRFIK